MPVSTRTEVQARVGAIRERERTATHHCAAYRLGQDGEDFRYDTSPARRVLRQFDTEVQRSEYTDVTTLTVGVRRSEVDAFVEAFTNALSDRGELLRVGS